MSRRFRPLVLCYHAISTTWPHALAVAPEAFGAHLRFALARGYRPATAAEILSGRGRRVHVTFDDAYRTVARVLPLLERLGVPATVFACTGYAAGGRPLDVRELADEVRSYPDDLATMDWNELRSLGERGVEVGSHTVTHPHLTALADAELDRELRESREQLADELGRPCRFLAYPYGDDDDRVHAAARRAGYDAAFALPGRVRPINLHALPRVGVYRRDSVVRLSLKTSALARASAARRVERSR